MEEAELAHQGLVECGGGNLAATFSPELADIAIHVIDVAIGKTIPRKGGLGSRVPTR